MIVGNDISKFQGVPDWDTYKNNSNFCIIKATEGTSYTDPQFPRNQEECRRVGIPLGFYHFARPDLGNDAAHEADYFLNVVGTPKEGEILCLDFEVTYGDAVNWCKTFLDRVKFMLNGYKPLIYLNQSQVKNLNWHPIVDAGYGLWIAAYTYDPNNNNFATGAWPFAAIQQWTDKQVVPGLAGSVDGDVLFGDVNTFKAYGYHKPVPVPPPQPPPVVVPPPVTPPPVIPPPVIPPSVPPVVEPEKHDCKYFAFGVYICTLKK